MMSRHQVNIVTIAGLTGDHYSFFSRHFIAQSIVFISKSYNLAILMKLSCLPSISYRIIFNIFNE